MKFIKKFSLKPVTLFVVTLILLTMFSIFALIEYFQSKRDILSIMEDEGLVLLDALMAGAERSILAYEALEAQTQKQLLNGAYAIETLDYASGLTNSTLNSLVKKINIYRVYILNDRGERVLGDTDHPGIMENQSEDEQTWLYPLLSGAQDSIVVGFQEGKFIHGPHYTVAVHRRRGGAVVVAADANDLLELRREVGPGRFIQEIGNRTGVVYVVLQDTLGIRMASRGVQRISSVSQDPFLLSLYQKQGQASRITSFNDQDVFEIIAAFRVEDQILGIFRIGLNMTSYQNLNRSAQIRLLLIGISLLFLGIVGFSLVVATQNVRLLSESYLQVKTHTSEILQNLKDAVLAVDGAGMITVFNAAAASIYMMPRESVIGKAISEFDMLCFNRLKETLRTGVEIKLEENECLIQGVKKILRINTSIVRNSMGIIDAAILVATDLTQQRHLEDTLRRQEKLQAMGALASGVAHEIRNPINAIGMIAQRFRKEFRPSDDQKEYHALTEAMLEEVKRINRIIQQFLEFAKPPALQMNQVSIRQFIEDVHAVFRSTASSAQLEFLVTVKDEAILNLDIDQMKQALLNLLKNGLEACSPGDHLQLTGHLHQDQYIIDIEDSGHGIPESDLNRIFDLYFTTKTRGTGIGLPMVVQIVQNHGGSIEVKSQIRKGSRFRISLPLLTTEI